MGGLLTATTAVVPASILAVSARVSLTSHDSTPPSQFIDTLIFYSSARVNGVDGVDEGGAAAEEESDLETSPNCDKLSAAAMRAINVYFFLDFAKAIPLAIVRGGSGSDGACGFHICY